VTGMNICYQKANYFAVREDISDYAYKHSLINLTKSLSWKASKKATYFTIENNEFQFRVEKKINNNRLACECYFWNSMRIPTGDKFWACSYLVWPGLALTGPEPIWSEKKLF